MQTTITQPINTKPALGIRDLFAVKLADNDGEPYTEYLKAQNIEKIIEEIVVLFPQRRIISVTQVKYFSRGQFESQMFKIASLAGLLHNDCTPLNIMDKYIQNNKEVNTTRLSSELLDLINNVELLETMVKEVKKKIWMDYELLKKLI